MLVMPNPAIGQQGVVFVRGERIEFADATRSGDLLTATGLRRATRGTSRGDERRSLWSYIGNNTLRRFSMNGFVAGAPVEVALWEPMPSATPHGHRILRPVEKLDYEIEQTSPGNADVVFQQAPPAGWAVVISMTDTPLHPAGSPVFDGTDTFDGPIIPDQGRHEAQTREALEDGR